MTESDVHASFARLTRMRLRTLHYESLSKQRSEPDHRSDIRLEVSTEVNQATETGEQTTGLCVVRVFTPTPPAPDARYTLDATYEGSFAAGGALQTEFETFMQKGAPAILWPFLREVVASITSKGGGRAVYLPLINFAALSPTPVQHPEPGSEVPPAP